MLYSAGSFYTLPHSIRAHESLQYSLRESRRKPGVRYQNAQRGIMS